MKLDAIAHLRRTLERDIKVGASREGVRIWAPSSDVVDTQDMAMQALAIAQMIGVRVRCPLPQCDLCRETE